MLSLLSWASLARVTPVHYTIKALNSSPTTLQRSPWGGFHYPASPPNNTLPIIPLFNPIPPGIDTRGLQRGCEEMCAWLCARVCCSDTVYVFVWTASCPRVLVEGCSCLGSFMLITAGWLFSWRYEGCNTERQKCGHRNTFLLGVLFISSLFTYRIEIIRNPES